MSMPKPLRSLSRLVDLRETEVCRLTADMENKRVQRDRYRANLERLERLYDDVGASGALSPALSLNCAAYKQTMINLAHEHRQDLILHEADMAVAQRTLTTAVHRHEILGKVLEQRQHGLLAEQQSREQKRQDELASQVWWRRHK